MMSGTIALEQLIRQVTHSLQGCKKSSDIAVKRGPKTVKECIKNFKKHYEEYQQFSYFQYNNQNAT